MVDAHIQRLKQQCYDEYRVWPGSRGENEDEPNPLLLYLKQNGYDEHHVWPGSRGGGDEESNLLLVPRKTLHLPYNYHFRNSWPHEAALLRFFCEETINPLLQTSWDGSSKKLAHASWAWEQLFGTDTNRDATAALREKFLPPGSLLAKPASAVAMQMLRTEKIIQCAKRYDIIGSGIDWGRIIPCRDGPLQPEYTQIFGTFHPHAAIMLTFTSWQTICATEELLLSQRFGNVQNDKAARKFDKRVKAWVKPFQGLDRWGVIEKIAHEFGGLEGRHENNNSVARAIKLCQKLEHLSCVTC